MTEPHLCKCSHPASFHVHGESGEECRPSCGCTEWRLDFRFMVRDETGGGSWLDDVAEAGRSAWEAKNGRPA